MLMPIQMGGQISPPPRIGSVGPPPPPASEPTVQYKPQTERERERKGLLMNEWMDGGWIGKTLWNGECEMGEWKYESLAYTHFHLSSQKLWISNHCHSSFELQCKSKRGVGIGKDALTFVGVGRHLHGNTAPTLSPFSHPFDPSIPLSMRMMMTMIKKYICTSVSIETEVDEDTA